MYETFYGFTVPPFEIAPDPRFLFLSASHQEALTNLQYGLSAGKTLTVLTGEVGSGKSTLVRRSLAIAEQSGARCAFLANPGITSGEFTAFLARHFHLSTAAEASSVLCLEELERTLRQRRAEGILSALVVDEAQSLSTEMFEYLRLITNLETETSKLLPVVLVGQPELGVRLNTPELRNLKQRITLRCTLDALSLQESAAYIASRVSAAGGRAATVFTREAVTALHHASKGLPRSLTILCDNALVTGFALGERPVTVRVVEEVCRDFEISQTSSTAADATAIDAAPRADATSGEAEEAADAPAPRPVRQFSILGMSGR